MNPLKLRSRVAVPAAAIALLVVACGDDGSSPPPAAGPDTTRPQPIQDLTLSYDSPGHTVVFAWSAPRDDDAHERADRYDIRYSDSFPFDWERALRVADPPDPATPGAEQQLTLANPARGHDFYASMRAIDAAGNVSPTGTVAHVRVPGFSFEMQCVDVFSGAPVAGIDAVVTTRDADHFATGADGRVTLADLAGGTIEVRLSKGSSPGDYHSFRDSFTLNGDVLLVIPMIPFQQPNSALFPSILALLDGAIFSPGAERVIRRWQSYPVPFYARDFVNVNGLDYRALLQQAADRWNARLGFQMFTLVIADPSVGMLVEFLPRSTMGSVNGVTEYANDASGYPVHDRIRIVDDMIDGPRLYSIVMHELGHTIPLQHLPDGFIMFGGQPLPSDISDDEVTMVKLLLALPNGTVLDHYDAAPPAR